MNQHPKYWLPDGNIVLQAGNTLFCLHKSILFMHSDTLETLLTLPSGVENDGQDSTHPIRLEGISSDEFEHFVTWVYHVGSVRQQHTISSLTAVLKVSRLWMIENSITWAISELEKLSLTPAHKLELARMYMIPEWIPEATKALILSPLHTVGEDDISRLGLRVYSVIAKAREMIEYQRKTMAAVPPGLSLNPHLDCPSSQHQHCKEAWIRFWWQKVARQLLHPTNPLSFNALLEYVTNQPQPDGLKAHCRERFVEEIIESGGLDVEAEIINRAVVAIQAYFATL